MIKSSLKALMEERGLTIMKMAELTGLATETISRARDARIGACTLNTLATIAAALGVKVKDLFEEE
ncbi:MAG: helix-turn-helix domain-containing protein [Desulfovibrio sp.]